MRAADKTKEEPHRSHDQERDDADGSLLAAALDEVFLDGDNKSKAPHPNNDKNKDHDDSLLAEALDEVFPGDDGDTKAQAQGSIKAGVLIEFLQEQMREDIKALIEKEVDDQGQQKPMAKNPLFPFPAAACMPMLLKLLEGRETTPETKATLLGSLETLLGIMEDPTSSPPDKGVPFYAIQLLAPRLYDILDWTTMETMVLPRLIPAIVQYLDTLPRSDVIGTEFHKCGLDMLATLAYNRRCACNASPTPLAAPVPYPFYHFGASSNGELLTRSLPDFLAEVKQEKDSTKRREAEDKIMKIVTDLNRLLSCEESDMSTYRANVCMALINDGKILIYLPKVFLILRRQEKKKTLDINHAGNAACVGAMILGRLVKVADHTRVFANKDIGGEGLVALLMGTLRFLRGYDLHELLPGLIGTLNSLLSGGHREEVLRLLTLPEMEMIPSIFSVCKDFPEDERIIEGVMRVFTGLAEQQCVDPLLKAGVAEYLIAHALHPRTPGFNYMARLLAVGTLGNLTSTKNSQLRARLYDAGALSLALSIGDENDPKCATDPVTILAAAALLHNLMATDMHACVDFFVIDSGKKLEGFLSRGYAATLVTVSNVALLRYTCRLIHLLAYTTNMVIIPVLLKLETGKVVMAVLEHHAHDQELVERCLATVNLLILEKAMWVSEGLSLVLLRRLEACHRNNDGVMQQVRHLLPFFVTDGE